MNKIMLAFLVQAVFIPLFPSTPGAGSSTGSASVTINPDLIEVGTFYHRRNVRVVADVPQCDGVVLEIRSEAKTIVLNRKGRIGFVWMNVAQITVEGAPEVYILASSDDVESICSAAERGRLEIGFASLRRQVSFSGETSPDDYFDEFVKLKKHAGTYIDHIPVAMQPKGDGRYMSAADVPIASVIPPGQYELKLYCFDDGILSASTSASLTIKKTGLPRFEGDLAHRQPAVYGAVAVLFAMLAGVTMGVIFSSKGH